MHIMMLLMCQYLGFDKKNYTSANHPLQKLIQKKQEEIEQLGEKEAFKKNLEEVVEPEKVKIIKSKVAKDNLKESKNDIPIRIWN